MTVAEPPPPMARRGGVRASALVVRLLTAAIGIPLLLAMIWLGGWPYTVVVMLALVAGYVEFARAVNIGTTALAVIGAATIVGLVGVAAWDADAMLAVLAVGAMLSLALLVLRGATPPSLAPWSLSLAGIVWIGVLGAAFVRLRSGDDGRAWVLFALLTTFATDTGAYALGRLIGRHRLAPRISPSKTVEGALGGLIAACAAAVALNAVLGLGQPLALIAVLGAVVAVAAQFGDLAESLIKRAAGVKDMSTMLPGHGGLLDRLDSLLFAVAVVEIAVRWAG